MSDSARSNVVLEIGSKIRAGVSVTYGDPVELDGVELVPVAAACYGFGGGSDGDANGGGGGGSMSVPLGAYVARDGGVRFEPNTTVLAALAVPIVAVVGCVVVKAIKACRR
ncbi:hypothetical protein Xcel_0875 [Xylanimonas cellulosilytica DSM 15894]|uniref:Sporulation protein YtfJ n=1 Tax=Xylanimonas cellulosilytica (strain DSM 15894 / JCM 12276 / CECT 5975 / KCTC 9989 / LMG 20990 / NBRC 107835 / XIL07) TaxID=446471 RepID=D1BY64_XYLCX|nr:hypothetical protein [Xylanimonas cellulosilytica]ACZ29907.1 hypothetical protein Xcel_0875 [Xylanimonas cellulosilytica DSM 15894]